MFQRVLRTIKQFTCVHRWHLFTSVHVAYPKGQQKTRVTLACMNCAKLQDVMIDHECTRAEILKFCLKNDISVKERND